MWAIFIASFIFIFIKAFQQLNVVGGHYMWVMPTSMAMAIAEATVIIKVATLATLWVAVPMGSCTYGVRRWDRCDARYVNS